MEGTVASPLLRVLGPHSPPPPAQPGHKPPSLPVPTSCGEVTSPWWEPLPMY